MYDSLMRAGNDPEPILKRFFVDDPARMRGAVPDTVLLLKGLYTLGAICGCVDYLGIDLFTKYFTEGEVRAMAIPYTNRIYGNYGNSVEFGDRCSWAAKWLLEDIVRRADMALADGSACAADLRFGHDTGIMPLAALIGLGDMGTKLPRATAHLHFNTAERMTMASNIQMIFYKGKKGDILVRVMYNEKDQILPLKDQSLAPYYSWEAFKEYYEPKCREAQTIVEGFFDDNPVLEIEGGRIQGVKENGALVYKGVPFAAPPVGELRGKPLQPVIPWNGIKKADTFPLAATQPKMSPDDPLYYREFYTEGSAESGED